MTFICRHYSRSSGGDLFRRTAEKGPRSKREDCRLQSTLHQLLEGSAIPHPGGGGSCQSGGFGIPYSIGGFLLHLQVGHYVHLKCFQKPGISIKEKPFWNKNKPVKRKYWLFMELFPHSTFVHLFVISFLAFSGFQASFVHSFTKLSTSMMIP